MCSQCTGGTVHRAWGKESPETELESSRLYWAKGLSMMSGGSWCQKPDENILENKCGVKQRGLHCRPHFGDDQGAPGVCQAVCNTLYVDRMALHAPEA